MNFALKDVADEVPADVCLVSITCDPDIDTPETLARYAELFSAEPDRWKFLTGKMSDLERIANENFQVALKKQEHSERAFVVDRQGHLRGRFNILDPDQVPKLAALVKQLDAELNRRDARVGAGCRADKSFILHSSAFTLEFLLPYLPTINATLNATATVLLVVGYRLIKASRQTAHKRVMLSAFAVSIVFLICYLTYHAALRYETGQGHVTFQGPPGRADRLSDDPDFARHFSRHRASTGRRDDLPGLS